MNNPTEEEWKKVFCSSSHMALVVDGKAFSQCRNCDLTWPIGTTPPYCLVNQRVQLLLAQERTTTKQRMKEEKMKVIEEFRSKLGISLYEGSKHGYKDGSYQAGYDNAVTAFHTQIDQALSEMKSPKGEDK